MDNVKQKQLLKKILSHLESSGNVNTYHKKIENGLHKGHTAIGEFGLMLNTAKEMSNRKKLLKKADQKDLELLNNVNTQEDFEKFLKENPHKYNEYTDMLVDKVYDGSGGNIPIAATMWRWGHNLSKEKAEEILKNKPLYEKRIIEILDKLSREGKNEQD